MSVLDPNDPFAALRAAGETTPAAEFWRQWQRGAADIQTFLAARPPLSRRDLAAIVRVDLRQRGRRGERPLAEEYFAQFPQLSEDTELAMDVIFEEFLAREEGGEHPELSEYQRRFPPFAQMLSDQIAFHQAIDQCDQGLVDETHSAEPSDEPTVASIATPPDRPTRLDADYEILQEIGRGGMGVVFKARQVGLNRMVALKMVRAADSGNADLLARFRAEAEVVAALHHPHIVQVYDYGEHDGLPYLALEWVEGGTLASRLDGKPWSPQKAAALIAELAQAVHFAHENRVIHRDLKPANLLVASDEGALKIKIADFGLAKVFRDLPSAQDTQTGALLGTPSYMAPEQASGRARQIGPSTDVYALGAILYELLTGRPPFRGETSIETLQQVLAAEPVSIHRLVPRVPRDLATICAKCLMREPPRRYASAAELSDDLRRFLADQPIQARRSGRMERGWRWCRRNPSLALALGSVAALLVAVASVSTWYSGRLSRQLTVTQQAEEAAQVRLWDAYLAEIAARNSSRQVGQRFAALEAVDKAAALLDAVGRTDQRVLQLRSAALNSLALPDFGRVRILGDYPESAKQRFQAIAADRYLASTPSGGLAVFQLSDGSEVQRIEGQGPLAAPNVSPDGQYVAASVDGETRVWRVDGPQPAIAWQSATLHELAFAPNARYAATSDQESGMRLIDVATGATICKLGSGTATSSFAFHDLSRRVAVCASGALQVISCDTGQILTKLPQAAENTLRVAWHPNGQYIAAWENGPGLIALWDVRTQEKVLEYVHTGFPWTLHFTADGSRLLSYSLWDQHLILWDVGTGQRQLELRGVADFASALTPQGKTVFVRSMGSALELWELAVGAECLPLASALHPSLGICHRASVSPDNRILAVSRERGLELWDLATCQRILVWPGGRCMAEFDVAGDLVLACKAGIFHWPRTDADAARGKSSANSDLSRVVRFGPPHKRHGPVDPTSLSAGRIGQAMAFIEADGWAAAHGDAWQNKTHLEPEHDARRAAVSNDGRHVVLGNWEDGGASVFELPGGQRLLDLKMGKHVDPQISADDRWLATSPDGVRLWRVADWTLTHELHAKGTYPAGLGIAFSPDSRVLAVGQTDGIVRLVDPESGADWARLSRYDLGSAARIVYSPDQTRLVTLQFEDELTGWVWNLAAMRPELAKRGLDWPADVLRCEARSIETKPIEVVMDDGGLLLLLDTMERRSNNPKAAIGP